MDGDAKSGSSVVQGYFSKWLQDSTGASYNSNGVGNTYNYLTQVQISTSRSSRRRAQQTV